MNCCSQKSSLVVMIVLTTTFFLVEIVVGYLTKSMALVADSFHMLSDVASLFIGYFAVKFSQSQQHNADRNTFGWVRAEVLGALINAVFLIALCFSIFVESLTRFVEPVRIEQPILVLVVGAIGLVVNLFGMCLFHGHAGHGHSHGHNHGHGHSHGKSEHHHDNVPVMIGLRSDDSAFSEITMVERSKMEDKIEGFTFQNQGFANNSPPGSRHSSLECDTIERKSTTKDDESASQHMSIDVIVTADDGHEVVYVEATTSDDAVSVASPTPSSGHQSQMNMKAVYLHVLGDALGSVVVIVSALVVHFVDRQWVVYIDPSMSIFLVLIILHASIPLMKESSLILLQTVPTHIQMQELKSRLLVKFPLIKNVHDFHIWQLAGSKIIASLHVKVIKEGDYMTVSESLKQFFHNEGIHSTTIQPEFIENDGSLDRNCLLECSSGGCVESKCCKPIEGEAHESSAGVAPSLVAPPQEEENTETNE